MTKHLPRWGVLLLVVGALMASCAGTVAYVLLRPPAGNPDPGNRRLHALAADPIFAQLPAGAVPTSREENPAKYRGSLFEGYGWDGPNVLVTFTSSQSVLEVYQFYAERAQQTGWTPVPGKKLSNGLIWAWSKSVAGKKSGIAISVDFDLHSVDVKESGVPRGYRLSGFT